MEDTSEKNKGLSRRNLLKAAGVVALGTTLGSIAKGEHKYKPRFPEPPPIPTELPKDILSEKELATAHIKIYNTDSVQLYLRKSALELFPVLKDTKKYKEVSIILVDSDGLSPSAISRLSQDAQQLYRMVIELERKRIEEEVSKGKIPQVLGGQALESLDLFGSGLSGLFVNAIAFEKKDSEILKSFPDSQGKIAIYLPVSDKEEVYKDFFGTEYTVSIGNREPKPKNSFPQPKDFKMFTDSNYGVGYITENPKETHPGFVLRHELSHYANKDEVQTDFLALSSIKKAWRIFQDTGSTQGYPFVFVTPQGTTITRRIKPEIQGTENKI